MKHEIDELVERARRWLCIEQDVSSRQTLQRQLDSGDIAGLRAGFDQPLTFGTAGLRGEVGPGPGRVNLETISQVSWALGQYLLERAGPGLPLVVVGFDARPDSERFAKRTAQVLSALGVRVLLTDGIAPTPLIAFAVRDLKASAGVVVTASHNPRPDNGYKVYDEQGIQIVSPWDTEIMKRMEQFPSSQHIQAHCDSVSNLDDVVVQRYFSHVAAVAQRWVPEVNASHSVSIAYTPLHGVGFRSAQLATNELPVELIPVAEQVEPDGLFPTIEFPNPEEVGALDRLLELAESRGASVAIANDPDADRFALCLPLETVGVAQEMPLRAAGHGKLTRLSGDALGLLLADLCLQQSSAQNSCIVSTVVSTPGLEELVRIRGGRVERTLTGFKWLCRAAVEQSGFVFAYEEALGYCLAGPEGSSGVMDKDGISALATVARLLSHCGGGEALAQRLLNIYCEIGLWGSFGHSRRFSGADAELEMRRLMENFREASIAHILGMTVTQVTDFAIGAELRPWYLGPQNLIQLDFVADTPRHGFPAQGRVLIRPSGTEPKVKAYVHLCSTMTDHNSYCQLERVQTELARQIADLLLGSTSKSAAF